MAGKPEGFERWFAEDFQQALEAVTIPGMPDASWDRRAAYLLWLEIEPTDFAARPAVEGPVVTDDSFGGLV